MKVNEIIEAHAEGSKVHFSFRDGRRTFFSNKKEPLFNGLSYSFAIEHTIFNSLEEAQQFVKEVQHWLDSCEDEVTRWVEEFNQSSLVSSRPFKVGDKIKGLRFVKGEGTVVSITGENWKNDTYPLEVQYGDGLIFCYTEDGYSPASDDSVVLVHI